MIEKFLLVFITIPSLLWTNAVYAYEDQSKITACDNCHNPTNTVKSYQVPSLAGQNSAYLIKQISLFSDNLRVHPLLSIKSYKLSQDDVKSLALHYQNLEPANSAKIASNEAELLYEPCSACHGNEGEGVAPFPRLRGQKSSYLEQQLVNFKNGKRQNSLMQAMTINISEQDIKLLASYLGK